MKNRTIFLLCTLLAGSVSACGNDRDSGIPQGRLRVQESPDGIEVSSHDGSVSIRGNQHGASIIIKTDDGKDISLDYGGDRLSPDFPGDVPILPGSTVAMNQVFQSGRSAIATLTSSEVPETVIRFYEEQIPLKGWQPGPRFDLDNIIMLNGSRGSASLNISITAEQDQVTINMARTESIE